MKPISIQLYTLREAAAKDFPTVLKQVADIGYVGVEFAGLNGMQPKEVKKIVDDLGLQVSSAHMGLPTRDTVSQIVDECKTLGIPRCITGFGPDDMKTVDGCKALAAKLQTGADLLKGTGIAMGMHNHNHEFHKVDGQYPEDIILNNAPDVFAELDVYWVQVGGADPAETVARLKHRAPVLHIKDGPVSPASPMSAVGEGKVDIPAVVKAADPNILEWLIVEIDACPGDMLDAVKRSYKYLVGNGLAKGNK
jgi:sugar phosphate isomerase/epimerase